MIRQNRFPMPIDAYSYLLEQVIPPKSVVSQPNGSEFEVERSNGFVLTAYSVERHEWLKVDLRDRSNIVYLVSTSEWVEQQELF